MPGEHSRFSPSSAERWMACTAAVQMGEFAPPEPPSPYAEEGTRAHALLELCIKEGRYPRPDEGDDAEMRESVTETIDHVISRGFLPANGVDDVWSERRLPMAYGEDEAGTADITILSRYDILEVIDFKYGRGVWVPVVDNWQMVAYMGAAALDARKQGRAVNSYRATIIQPRAGGQSIRSWSLTPQELDHLTTRLHVGWLWAKSCDDMPAERIFERLNPGETQCRFCPAKPFCPAVRGLALDAAAKHFAGVQVQSFGEVAERTPDWPVGNLTAREVAEIKAAAPVIRNWLKEVEARALEDAKQGRLIPGHKLVEAHPKREYMHEDDELNAMMLSSLTGGALAPSSFMRPPTVQPMTEAEKRLKSWASENAPAGKKRDAAAQIAASMADMLDKKPGGRLELVPETDPRPAVNPGKDFAGVVVPPASG